MNNKTVKVMTSKDSDHWATPKKIYNYFMDKGYFDPCPFKSKFDGLSPDFKWGESVFINPPYSDTKTWADATIEKFNNKEIKNVIMLIPSRTDTKYFHKLIENGYSVKFIKGRLYFNDGKNPAIFPSIFIIKGLQARFDVDTLLHEINGY